jgi:hypothetical protein
MKQYIGYIIGLIALIIFIWFYIKMANFEPIEKDDLILKKITELELKIDSIKDKKDSIRLVIDSTHVKIISNENHYQERVNIIMRQYAATDSGFIADYIRLYSKQNSLPYSK